MVSPVFRVGESDYFLNELTAFTRLFGEEIWCTLLVMVARRRYPCFVRQIGGLSGMTGGLVGHAVLSQLGRRDIHAIYPSPAPDGIWCGGPCCTLARGRLGSIALWLAVLGVVSLAEGSDVSDWFLNDYGWGSWWGFLYTQSVCFCLDWQTGRGAFCPFGTSFLCGWGYLEGL